MNPMIVVGGTTVVTPPPPTPGAPPPYVWPAQVDASPLSWQWTSYTGETWNLTDLSSPVLKLRGALGAGQVDPEHWWGESPSMPGSTWNGYRTPRGSVFLPLMVRGTDSNDFLRNHAAFYRSLNPQEEGTLRVTRPDGQWREIKCRYVSGADTAMDLDPIMRLFVSYGITWETADPYWSGEPVWEKYADATPGSFLVAPGPPFNINSRQTVESARFTNPGDVESAPIWRVNGPFTSFRVGLGASVVEMTLTKAADQWVEIDMRPRKGTVLDEAGVDQRRAMTQRKFAAIPPGVDVPANVFVGGTGAGTSVVLTFTPKYRSAWA